MKKLRIVFIIVFGLFFYSMLLSSVVRNIYLSQDGGERWGVIAKPIKFIAEVPSLFKKSLESPEFLVNNKKSEDGINYFDKSGIDQYPNLLVSYKDQSVGQKFELIDVQTGKILKRWEPDNEYLYNSAYNALNPTKPTEGSDLYFLHPFLLPDSSLIFTSQLTSMITRVDKNSQISWLKNDKVYHHTTEQDHEGNIYVCSRPFTAGKYDMLPKAHEDYKQILMDDEITKINPDNGNILFNKSVMEILLENGYEDLLLSKGQFISDPIHLNDVQPALTDSEYWQKGDLLVSCRNLSSVFIYRPSTNKIIWLQHGPWYNQHDADFLDNNKVVVFGNNVIREESTIDPKIAKKNLYFSNKRGNNEVYVYNFEQDTITTPYSRLMSGEKVSTYTSGRCDILPNGDLFVEDTNNGRIIFGDSINKKIEYVKRIDEDNISSLFWSRLIY